MTLNEGQSKALDEILSWLNSDEPFYCLIGYAGTGKSYLVKHLVDILVQADSRDKVCLVAPTNKAVKVLQNLGTNCPTSTLHSLLGLKAKQSYDNGKMYFEKDMTLSGTHDKMSVDDFTLIIVDESGMLNKELFDMLKGYQTKFLFLGDDAQLPPVGEPTSIVWQEVTGKSYLTEVVRYGGKILELATCIRSDLKNRNQPVFKDFVGEGVDYLNPRKFKNACLDAIEYAIETDNPNHIRILCYRNAAVGTWNSEIRDIIYGGYSQPSYQPGEWLMANEPITVPHPSKPGKRQVILNNSSEFKIDEVLGITEVEEIPCYELRLGVHTIYVCDPIQEYTLVNTLEQIAIDAKQTTNKDEKRRLWRKYWELKDLFANVSYTYAITTNKSQGSTYDIAAVDTLDIYNCRQIEERNRRAYTAITRPRNQLLLY